MLHSVAPEVPKRTLFVPSTAILWDILSLSSVLLVLPEAASLWLLFVHAVLDCFGGYKCVIHGVLFNEFQFKRRVSVWMLTKVVFTDVVVFCFVVLDRKHQTVDYMEILAKSLISWDVIGVSSNNINKQFNVAICFLLVNYIRYIVHWFLASPISHFTHMTLASWHLLLSIHVVMSSLFFPPIVDTNAIAPSHVSHVNCDSSKLLSIDVENKAKGVHSSIVLHNLENILTKRLSGLVQPFWAVLAAVLVLLRRPSLFVGKAEPSEPEATQNTTLKMSMAWVDDQRVVFEALDGNLQDGDVTVCLNNIDWNLCRVVDDKYLLVYGLMPSFRYEIDVARGESHAHFVVNTTGADNKHKVSNQPVRTTSSHKTLQLSLLSQISNLGSLRIRNKKLKKDEHKKTLELSKSIEALKTKISKYNGDTVVEAPNGDHRVVGKLKGLQHTVSQLENEISALGAETKARTQEKDKVASEFAAFENDMSLQLGALNDEFSAYEARLQEDRDRLKSASNELAQARSKNSKLAAKHQAKQADVKALEEKLGAFHKDISTKVNKRIKKLNDNFSVILPNVAKETELLERYES